MAGSLNKVMLIGRLTRDPEMRYTAQGTAVTNFGLATNRYLPQGETGERREQTDFHDIVVFNMGRRNLAEIVAQYTKKGALVYLEGRLQTRSWEDQQGQSGVPPRWSRTTSSSWRHAAPPKAAAISRAAGTRVHRPVEAAAATTTRRPARLRRPGVSRPRSRKSTRTTSPSNEREKKSDGSA